MRAAALVLLMALLAGCAGLGPVPAVDLAAEADAAYAAGDYARAAQAYERLAQQSEADATVWYRLGNSRAELDQPEAAITAYRQALRLQPEHARARHNLGLVHLRLGVSELLEARRHLPEVDPAAEATVRYLACTLETLLGRAAPASCDAAD